MDVIRQGSSSLQTHVAGVIVILVDEQRRIVVNMDEEATRAEPIALGNRLIEFLFCQIRVVAVSDFLYRIVLAALLIATKPVNLIAAMQIEAVRRRLAVKVRSMTALKSNNC